MLSACDRPEARPQTAPGYQTAKQDDETAPLLGISANYHGELLDSSGEAIALDTDAVLALQKEMLVSLMASSTSSDAAVAEKLLGSMSVTDSEQIVINDVVAVWLMSRDPALRATWSATHDMLHEPAIDQAALKDSFWEEREELLGLIQKALEEDPDETLQQQISAGQAYIDECRSRSVPIPPDWPPTAAQTIAIKQTPAPIQDIWQRQVDLSAGVQVYTYRDSSEPGICYALPRLAGDQVDLLGIICQSAATGAACFWDNIDTTTGRKLTGSVDSLVLTLSELKNGNNLTQNCTGCHRGENVFLIHPETSLYQGGDSQTSFWYEPISTQADWENPPAFRARYSGECSSCHAIGALEYQSGYCGVVAGSTDNTMPPYQSPAGWLSPRSPYDTEVDAIRTACETWVDPCGTEDTDGDGVNDDCDDCPNQASHPAEGVALSLRECEVDVGELADDWCSTDCAQAPGKADDNCAAAYNPSQSDIDGDGEGDLCDADIDGDGRLNAQDKCPSVSESIEIDNDNDGFSTGCDCDDSDPTRYWYPDCMFDPVLLQQLEAVAHLLSGLEHLTPWGDLSWMELIGCGDLDCEGPTIKEEIDTSHLPQRIDRATFEGLVYSESIAAEGYGQEDITKMVDELLRLSPSGDVGEK